MTKAGTDTRRDPYWDCLKMVLIFLVVFGHTLKHYVVVGSIGQGIYNFLYLFHMPLFIFISGRFSQCRDRRHYLRGMFRLIETYAVFQLILCLLNSFVLSHIPFTFNRLLFEPMWAMWYLLALFCWRALILLLTPRWLDAHATVVMTLSVVIGLAEGFLPADPYFTTHHILSSLPFFMAGYYSSRMDVRAWVSRIPSSVAWVVLAAVLLLFCLWLNGNIRHVLHLAYSYWYKPGMGVMWCLAWRCLVYVGAVVVSAMVMRVTPLSQRTAEWGKQTLVVYVYHPVVLSFVHKLFLHHLLPRDLLVLLAIALAVTALLVFAARFRCVRRLVNPITFQ